jgi:hypothetical protein
MDRQARLVHQYAASVLISLRPGHGVVMATFARQCLARWRAAVALVVLLVQCMQTCTAQHGGLQPKQQPVTQS